jgi:hypothetical protein
MEEVLVYPILLNRGEGATQEGYLIILIYPMPDTVGYDVLEESFHGFNRDVGCVAPS